MPDRYYNLHLTDEEADAQGRWVGVAWCPVTREAEPKPESMVSRGVWEPVHTGAPESNVCISFQLHV